MASKYADTRPGTNWTQVPPEHRKKINAIVKYYRKKPHPFAACVRDNRRRFGPRTEQVCAVVKDMAMGTTKWRKGGGKKHLSAAGVPATIDLSVAVAGLVELAELLPDEPEVIDLASPSAAGRMKMAKQKQALPGGRFPIKDHADVKKAVRAVGRTKPEDRPRVRAHIKRRVRALGASHLIPDHWKGS